MRKVSCLFFASLFPCLFSCNSSEIVSSEIAEDSSSMPVDSLDFSSDASEQPSMTASYDSTIGIEAKYEFQDCHQSPNTDWDFDYFHLKLFKGCTGTMQWKSRLGGIVMEEKSWNFTYTLGYHLGISYGDPVYIFLPDGRPCLDPYSCTWGTISDEWVIFDETRGAYAFGENGETYSLSIIFSIFGRR